MCVLVHFKNLYVSMKSPAPLAICLIPLQKAIELFAKRWVWGWRRKASLLVSQLTQRSFSCSSCEFLNDSCSLGTLIQICCSVCILPHSASLKVCEAHSRNNLWGSSITELREEGRTGNGHIGAQFTDDLAVGWGLSPDSYRGAIKKIVIKRTIFAICEANGFVRFLWMLKYIC